MQRNERQFLATIDAAINHRLLAKLPQALPMADKQAAIDYFVDHRCWVKDVSPAYLVKIAETIRLFPADWQAMIRAEFLAEPRTLRLPPSMLPLMPMLKPPSAGLVHRIEHGACEDLLPTLADGSIDLVLTSPPYANQMGGRFFGVPEQEMPSWLADRFDLLKPKMAEGGSVLLNLGPIIKNDMDSDYIIDVLIELKRRNWVRHRLVIWGKLSALPVGPMDRPKKSFEFLYWFSLNRVRPYCLPTAAGRPSKHIGMRTARNPHKHGHPIHGASATLREGIARAPDLWLVSPAADRGFAHPAKMPLRLADMAVRTYCRPGGMVVDPFAGSGTSIVAALNAGRSGIGFELERHFFNTAAHRLRDARKARSATAGRVGCRSIGEHRSR